MEDDEEEREWVGKKEAMVCNERLRHAIVVMDNDLQKQFV